MYATAKDIYKQRSHHLSVVKSRRVMDDADWHYGVGVYCWILEGVKWKTHGKN